MSEDRLKNQLVNYDLRLHKKPVQLNSPTANINDLQDVWDIRTISLTITWRSNRPGGRSWSWSWSRHLSRHDAHVGGLHHLRGSIDVHSRLITRQKATVLILYVWHHENSDVDLVWEREQLTACCGWELGCTDGALGGAPPCPLGMRGCTELCRWSIFCAWNVWITISRMHRVELRCLAKITLRFWLWSKQTITHQGDLRINNPHDNLGLKQRVGQLRVLQQHVPGLLGAVLHTQLDREKHFHQTQFWLLLLVEKCLSSTHSSITHSLVTAGHRLGASPSLSTMLASAENFHEEVWLSGLQLRILIRSCPTDTPPQSGRNICSGAFWVPNEADWQLYKD